MPRGYRDYTIGLSKSLQNPEEAAHYLTACLEGGSREVFLLALRQVAAVHGVAQVAKRTALGRETLYRTLSANGNPRLDTLLKLLDSAGLRLAVAAKKSRRRAA